MQRFINRPPELLTPKAKFPKLDLVTFAQEPSLVSCSPIMVENSGGELAKVALHHVKQYYKQDILRAEKAGLSAIIDTRVHRLMPGMFPAVPGWHCDAVPRCSYHGQPRFDLIIPEQFHVIVTLSTEPKGVSHTEFVLDTIHPKMGDNSVYHDLHREIVRIGPRTEFIPDGTFVKYYPKTAHRASAAHRRGWRMFFRFSMYPKPPIENVVPNVQQVYLLSEDNAW